MKDPLVSTIDWSAIDALAGSRNLREVWLVRLLLVLGVDDVAEEFTARRVLRKLGVSMPKDLSSEEKEQLLSRLVTVSKAVEPHLRRCQFPQPLRGNLRLLRRQFAFSVTESRLLGWVLLIKIDSELAMGVERVDCAVDSLRRLSEITGESLPHVERALDPNGRLRNSGLAFLIADATSLSKFLRPSEGALRTLTRRRIRSLDGLMCEFLRPAGPATLNPEDYSHIAPSFEAIIQFLRSTLDEKRAGTNLLLYGPPGTGKSQLCRVLAGVLHAIGYEVANENPAEQPCAPIERLINARSTQFFLAGRRCLVAFDEVDAIFRFGSSGAGPASVADQAKAWLNDLLEKNAVPMIWIANNIAAMDPAFVRRFDLVVRLEAPPQHQRLRLLERELGDIATPKLLQSVSRLEHVMPAVVARVGSTIRRMTSPEICAADELVTTVLDSALQAQGHLPLRCDLAQQSLRDFDPTLCNANEDLSLIMRGIGRTRSGRICLHGPPGTGKTAFGHWISQELCRPLVLKKASDLQSPWLGETEANIAQTFARAARDQAVLQIDEIDAFLRDRRQAVRSWEVSQVNEMLTQIEHFDGIFVATTNLMEDIDQAAMRRFDYKIRFDYLRRDQAETMVMQLLRECGLNTDSVPWSGAILSRLTPGDFSVVAQRHRIRPYTGASDVLMSLCREQEYRGEIRRSIGFV